MNNKNLNHVALILDGNKRWAIKNNISSLDGYKKGLDKIISIVNLSLQRNIKYLTLFTLSSENFYRISVDSIYKIILNNFEEFITELTTKKNIKIKVIGRKENLPNKIIEIINKCEEITSSNNDLFLNLAFNYGFKNEISDVINKAIKSKETIDTNNELKLRKLFYLGDIPDPDLLIRTGGYKRLSNFILYNLSYTEIFFIDTLWPDFSEKEYDQIISKYYKIERKYGL